jgi:hypothetical protein
MNKKLTKDEILNIALHLEDIISDNLYDAIYDNLEGEVDYDRYISDNDVIKVKKQLKKLIV